MIKFKSGIPVWTVCFLCYTEIKRGDSMDEGDGNNGLIITLVVAGVMTLLITLLLVGLLLFIFLLPVK